MPRNSRRRKPHIPRNSRNHTPKTKLYNKKYGPINGTYLGTVPIYDNFQDCYRTGIQVREDNGDIVRVYPNGDLMDKVLLSGVRVNDRVRIEVVGNTLTSNDYCFDHYRVTVYKARRLIAR